MIDSEQVKSFRESHEMLLERQAMQAKQERLQSAILVKVYGDARLADIVRVFEAGDERRKETMWRVACALPVVKGGL